jgi:hypothetical protein
MGLLDEAIREHLDLKRRRGADPAEVERAEREALGPVRRGPEGQLAIGEAEEQPVAYDDHPAGYEDADDGWDELTQQHEEAHAGASAPREGYEDEAYANDAYEGELEDFEPRAPADTREAPAAPAPVEAESPERPAPQALRFTSERGDEYDDAPPPHAAPPDPADVVRPDEHERAQPGETVEYDVEGEMSDGPADEKADEDVLEETPEFLQDTPDHDRLWFEQKPPRDFDFDG